jgi:hypothetical protein
LAEVVVPLARDVSQAVLDYTADSLTAVDRILGGFHDDGVSTEAVASTLFCFGCYVGEVFVRNAGAVWRLADETSMAGLAGFPLVIETGPQNFANPIGKVFKRVENGIEDALPYFYSVFSRPRLGDPA